MHDDTLSPATWLRQSAWPLWLEHGVDWQARAFHEWIDPASMECQADYRRLRVAARQIYVFSQAAMLDLPRARDAVRLGLDYLRTRARLPEGGYATRLGVDHTVMDRTLDLYDHAFVLLAIASAATALPDASLAHDAAALLDDLDRNFSHPEGGYRESIPDALPRRQNPHMHLLEALLAAQRAFGGRTYIDHAVALVELFLDRMLQSPPGALPEYFDDRLTPERDAAGRFQVEPGHHYEWIWLLDATIKLSAELGVTVDVARIEAAIGVLFAFADAFGVDPATGFAWDVIWSDGTVRDASFRLWPQTERLKAVACRPALSKVTVREARALLGRFSQGMPDGLWWERMDAGGLPRPGPAPASSLYHLTCALLECERLERA